MVREQFNFTYYEHLWNVKFRLGQIDSTMVKMLTSQGGLLQLLEAPKNSIEFWKINPLMFIRNCIETSDLLTSQNIVLHCLEEAITYFCPSI